MRALCPPPQQPTGVPLGDLYLLSSSAPSWSPRCPLLRISSLGPWPSSYSLFAGPHFGSCPCFCPVSVTQEPAATILVPSYRKACFALGPFINIFSQMPVWPYHLLAPLLPLPYSTLTPQSSVASPSGA